jgi:predicted TIM-barrel fold metal-dependent hydrolase
MGGIVDADSHVYEPDDVWDLVPPSDRVRARAAFSRGSGNDGDAPVTLNGAPGKAMNRSHLNRQAVWRPGMSIDDVAGLDPDTAYPPNPGASDPAARLADMDALGIDQAIVYPSLFLEYLPQVADPEAAAVLARAYNDWVWEMASATGGRVHPVAILPLQAPELAGEELRRVAGLGFRGALFRPAFYKLGAVESFASMLMTAGGAPDPDAPPAAPPAVFVEDKPFRPLWELTSQLGLVACVHPGLNNTGPDAVSSGGFAERVSERLNVAHTVAEPIAYMQDADLFVTAALYHGLFEDLPDLKVAIAHAGTTWVPLALEKCETYLWLGGLGSVPVCLETEEVWDRQPIITTFDSWERPVARMVERIGEKAAWGSRYPHHDAGSPQEARAMLERYAVDGEHVDRLMGGNASRLFGLAVPSNA